MLPVLFLGAFVGDWIWIDNDYLEPLMGQAMVARPCGRSPLRAAPPTT